ncbi:MAG: SdpI family protein [Myxococcota bacterium]
MSDETKKAPAAGSSTWSSSFGAPLLLICLGAMLSVWVWLNPFRFPMIPKQSVLTGMPILALLVFAFVRAAVSTRGRVSDLLLTWLIAFLMAIHTVLIAVAVGILSDLGVWVPVATGVLFVGLGPTMMALEPGSMMGLRVEATLKDEGVWRQIHRFLGLGFMAIGAVGAAVAAVDPMPAIAIMGIAPILWMLMAAARAKRLGNRPAP